MSDYPPDPISAPAPKKDSHRGLKIGSAVVMLAAAAVIAWSKVTPKSAAEVPNASRVFLCASTNKTYEHRVQIGEKEPLKCDICGKIDAYRPEPCYWTKDGEGKWKAKSTPTYVILKQKLDPASTEKTYCPDCGHEVKPHNPAPAAEITEPPTRDGR